MNFNRVFAIANHNTFEIPPIKVLLCKYITGLETIVDPFARNSKIGTITNDLNPNTLAQYHMKADDFCNMLLDQGLIADVGLFDPPYSRRQMKEMYAGVGLEFTNKESQEMSTWRNVKNSLGKLIKVGGYVICFGWNSHGMTKSRGFEMIEILLVWHGPGKNDTIVTVERKRGK